MTMTPDLLASARRVLSEYTLIPSETEVDCLKQLQAAIAYYSTPRDVPDSPGWWWMESPHPYYPDSKPPVCVAVWVQMMGKNDDVPHREIGRYGWGWTEIEPSPEVKYYPASLPPSIERSE